MPRNPPATSKSDESSNHLTDKPSRQRTHYSLMILTLIIMSHATDQQLIGAVLEPIKKEFFTSDTQMGLLAGLWFALFYAAGSIPIARIADKGSRRNVLAACCALWSFMTILCGMAANYWQLALARTGGRNRRGWKYAHFAIDGC